MEAGPEFDERFGDAACRRVDMLINSVRRWHDSEETLRCEFYDILIFFAAKVVEIESKRCSVSIFERPWNFLLGALNSLWPFRKKPKPEPKTVAALKPSITVSSHKSSDGMRLTFAISNVDFTYYDERGSRLVAPCTSITLEITGIDPWVSIGLFTEKEEVDEERIPF